MKLGAVVQLKSGGPLMTVVSSSGSTTAPVSHVKCQFFDGQGEIDEVTLPVEAVNPVEPKKPRRAKAKNTNLKQ